ncbi:MAG TPA: ATP-binding protein [Kofleriaceae bacterium]
MPDPPANEPLLAHKLARAEARLRRLDVLASALSAASTIDAVGRVLLDAGMDASGADIGALWRIEGSTAAIVAQAPHLDVEVGHAITLDGSSPIAQALASRAPVFVDADDARTWKRTDRDAMAILQFLGARACACLPLTTGDAVGAVVGFAFATAHVFEPGEREFLAVLVRHASIAFQRAVEHAAAERTAQRMRKLHEATEALTQAQTPRQVVDVTVRLGTEAIDAWGGVLWLAQPDGSLVLESVHNVPTSYHADWTRIPPGAALPVMRVFQSGRPIWIEGPEDFEREAPELVIDARAANRLWGSATLRLDGPTGPVGVLSFSYGAKHVFTADDREFLLALVRACEHALERARLFAAEEHARREAEAASVNKDRFLAMLGHELRNPLAAMVSAIDLIRLRDRQLGRELSVVDRHLGHLVHLVGALLEVSRITHGKITLQRTAVEVSGAVRHAIETARPFLDAADHQVSISVPPDLLADADRERLSQVLANVVTNAAQYTPRSGRIRISAALDGEHVKMVVRDNGIGIPPSLLPHLFDMFVQGERGADRREGGLGVGLTIVRTLVELHGGTVHAESDGPGKGATFVVRWPCANSETATAKMSALPRPETRRLRVLVADDNPDAADLLGELIHELGHEAIVVNDGASALRFAEEHGPHVAFLDVGLPEIDGRSLAQWLRAIPGLQTTPLIAITGSGQDGELERAQQAGFSHHLEKPLDMVAVAALLPTLR